MAKVIHHQLLVQTDTRFFKDIGIIGGTSIFERFDNVQKYLESLEPSYRHFFAYPVPPVNDENSIIEFHGISWSDELSTPLLLSTLDEESKQKNIELLKKNLRYFEDIIHNDPKSDKAAFLKIAIKYINEDFVFCYPDKVVLGLWGMTLRENIKEDITEIRKGVPKPPERPEPRPEPDNEKSGEGPTLPPPPRNFRVIFNASEHGNITKGQGEFEIEEGNSINHDEIPTISAQDGYEFTGWNPEPKDYIINEFTEFVAQYNQKPVKIPWWKRFWRWLSELLFGKGCLKWLVRLLIAALLIFLLIYLLRDCHGCNHQVAGGDALNEVDSTWLNQDPNRGSNGGIYDPNNPYQSIPTPPEYADILPPSEGVLPPISENPEIIPGNPSVLANRLNILMENEDRSILELARAFKNKYPDSKYKVVYYDNVVKRMQIEFPKEERDALKSAIPQQMSPEFDVFVFDESMFEGNFSPSDPEFTNPSNNYYLKAVHAEKAWDITKGSDKITVAVVDNGFHINHDEFEGKVVQPYNVWKHSSAITAQSEDHGTHVAGTAIANANNGEGICGIAPNCKFMPVQVADEQGRMTTTSVLDGIIYALYQGADVINVSLGGSFSGLSASPEDVQRDIINNRFKEEERLWREVMRIAAKHNSTIVVAAGNDNILTGIEPLQRPELFVTVSALNKSTNAPNKANFSNYGELSTVSAPGVGIFSSMGEDGYGVMDGTSMATPIVSGAIALMKSLKPSLTNKQIICILKNSGVTARGQVGNMIQIDKALQMVQSGNIPSCTPKPETGDVQVLLNWDNYNDLDLIVTDPNGESVWYKNRHVSSGGKLQIDMNVEYPDTKKPFENIYWPIASAPSGTYNVYVLFYKKHESNFNNNFKVSLVNGNLNETYQGTADNLGKAVHVCSFTTNFNSNEPNQSGELQQLVDQKKKLQNELDRINNELEKISRRRQ